MMNRCHRRLTRSSSSTELLKIRKVTHPSKELTRQSAVDTYNPSLNRNRSVTKPGLPKRTSCFAGVDSVAPSRAQASSNRTLSRGESFLTSQDDVTLFSRNEIMWGPEPGVKNQELKPGRSEYVGFLHRLKSWLIQAIMLTMFRNNDVSTTSEVTLSTIDEDKHADFITTSNKCDGPDSSLVHMCMLALHYSRCVLCLVAILILVIHLGIHNFFW